MGNDFLNIFENEIVPCEGEKKVKAYHVSQLKDRFAILSNAVYAEGILTITNKRIIYRTTKNDQTLDFFHTEVPIGEVSGVSIKRGQYPDGSINFSALKGFLLAWGLGVAVPLFAFLILGIVATLVYLVILLAVLAVNFVKQYKDFSGQNLGKYAISIMKLLFQNPLKQRMSSLLNLTIVSKGGTQGSITMATTLKGPKTLDSSAEVVPLDDLLVLSKEIGAIISDIQSGGEYSGNLDI